MLLAGGLVELGEARLEALEERVRVVVLGDVLQELLRDVREGAGLDLLGRELGPHQVRRGGARHREHAPLQVGPPQLLVHFAHGILVVRVRGRVAYRSHEVVRRRRHLAGESLEASRLVADTCVSPIVPSMHALCTQSTPEPSTKK